MFVKTQSVWLVLGGTGSERSCTGWNMEISDTESIWGGTGWYLVIVGQYGAKLVDTRR